MKSLKNKKSKVNRISIVVPFYNEEKLLARRTRDISKILFNHFAKYEIILVNDGSIDNSLQKAKKISKSPNIHLISYDSNQGRGKALKAGFKKCKYPIVGYIDSDSEINAKNIYKCAKKLKTFDSAIVSKNLHNSQVKAPLLRKIASRVFNSWAGLILKTGISDHQAGLKLFKKNKLKKVLDKVTEKRWLFDIELLYYFKLSGSTVIEIPIKVTYGFKKYDSSHITDFIKSIFFVLLLRYRKVKST